jgi:DNA (cytosine-5)-methyltransferase 1
MSKPTFIDLFCGIGGFRLGLESVGFDCVHSCDWNDHACQTYKLNFGDNPKGNIEELDEKSLVDFDIICGGFPCQPFSISGKRLGFDDIRGTMFFHIAKIIKEKKPKVLLLENVRGLLSLDEGNTFKAICETLTDLGYVISYQVLDAQDFGVPQSRERLLIVGIRSDIGKIFDFSKIEKNPCQQSLEYFLDKDTNHEYLDESKYTLISNPTTQKKTNLIFAGYLNKTLRKTGVNTSLPNLSRAHRQPNRIYDSKGHHPTLSSANAVWLIKDPKGVRRLTVNEAYRLMGFPNDFQKVGSVIQNYARIGNSICVNMVKAIAKQISTQIFDECKQ